MKRHARALFTPTLYDAVMRHLYQADHAEHAGAILCGVHRTRGRLTLTARRFIPATDGVDYIVTNEGHGRLQPLFVHNAISQAAEERLVYVGVHNHFSDCQVAFSKVDLASHQRAYPTYLSLARGMPVGAAVFGRRSLELDIWLPDGGRLSLDTARILGHGVRHLWSGPAQAPTEPYNEAFDRQLPFLRAGGQGLLRQAKIGIIGLGGIGSQLIEPLARVGIRHFVLIDPDRLELSNYSRVHGALPIDLPCGTTPGTQKVEMAKRLIHKINPAAIVTALPDDVAHGDAHRALLDCDFAFLAADTAEARFVCNAVSNQFFVPMTQVGTKIVIAPDGTLQRVFGVVRQIRPGSGCLWCNNLVDRAALANSAKPKTRRIVEKYGAQTPSPAVVTFNCEVASRSLNDFIMSYASDVVPLDRGYDYTLLDFVSGRREDVVARRDAACPFCTTTGLLAHGDGARVPTL